MVAYVTFLLTGESLLSRAIKVSTVKLYLKTVADYFRLQKEFNPTLDAIGAMPRRLSALFHEASRWEQMPNRSEALTPAMVACAFDKGLQYHPDFAIAAFGDWMILGLQAGFRISEYAQSHSSIHMSLLVGTVVGTDEKGALVGIQAGTKNLVFAKILPL